MRPSHWGPAGWRAPSKTPGPTAVERKRPHWSPWQRRGGRTRRFPEWRSLLLEPSHGLRHNHVEIGCLLIVCRESLLQEGIPSHGPLQSLQGVCNDGVVGGCVVGMVEKLGPPGWRTSPCQGVFARSSAKPLRGIVLLQRADLLSGPGRGHSHHGRSPHGRQGCRQGEGSQGSGPGDAVELFLQDAVARIDVYPNWWARSLLFADTASACSSLPSWLGSAFVVSPSTRSQTAW